MNRASIFVLPLRAVHSVPVGGGRVLELVTVGRHARDLGDSMQTALPLDGSVLDAPALQRAQVPVWLLDVDGVLNAVTANPDTTVWPRQAWLRAESGACGTRWPILAARPVLEFLVEVHATGAAEIRWHSSWQSDAAGSLASTLGLPALPIAAAPEFPEALVSPSGQVGGGPSWWKLPAAERVVAGERRALLWTDDDLIGQRRAYGLGRVEQAADRLLISPQLHLGLTPRHLREIRAYLSVGLTLRR